MPRLLVLIPLLIWLLRPDDDAAWPVAATLLTFGGCVAVPLITWYASLLAVRQLERGRRVHRGLLMTRTMALPTLVGWFGTCVFSVGWPDVVTSVIGDGDATLGLLLGTSPAYLGWAILLATDWPAVRRRGQIRRQYAIDVGREEPPPLPRLGRWWLEILRSHLLLTLAPLIVFWIVKDIAAWGLGVAGVSLSAEVTSLVLTSVGLLSALTVAPILVSRILPTVPIANAEGPASRLHELVRRAGLRNPSLLRAWHTDHSVANALAVGVLPRMRFVLLSDLMLRALPVWQLEAVLGHELGHLKHRHVVWFIGFFAASGLAVAGPVGWVYDQLVPAGSHMAWLDNIVMLTLLAGVLAGFVLLSRLFERQADVYAARLIGDTGRHVGPTGAWAFGEALRAAIGLNGSPTPALLADDASMVARLWSARGQLAHALHGSPERRVGYLQWLATDPANTKRFERRVLLTKIGIVLVATSSATLLMVS